MPDNKLVLKPETLSKLSNLELRARLVVEGFITGLHKSPYHGFSVEFAEHRQYMPGDELKHIDWKVLGKTGKYFVKQYEEETNLKSYILVDASGSMKYTSGTVTKMNYASYLAGALSYLMLKQRDAVGLAVFSDTIKRYIPPRSMQSYLVRILSELENIESDGVTDVSPAFHALAEKLKRKGLVIIISDLFDDPEKILLGLKHFRHNNHEVLLFHVMDPLELSFEFKREGVFKDIETDEEINTNPWHIRREYRQQVREMIDYYKRVCMENKIDYVLLDTSKNLDKALTEYLVKRKRLY